MECPKCGSRMSVSDSRSSEYGIRRRRKCNACGYKLTTYEITATQKAKYERSERRYIGLKQKIYEMANVMN